MRVSDWTRPVVSCWLRLLVYLVGHNQCSSFYFREYGVVKPDHPYMFVGEQLELYCNLTKLELLEDSTYLYFTHNGVHIPTEFLQVLTTRSVRLRYPITRPSDGGHFVCWLRQERSSSNPRTIGSQEVLADYKPVKVEDVKCMVNNWENMTCSWDLGLAYKHPDDITVSLVWTISGEQRDCPKGQMSKETCTWTQVAEDLEDRFLPGHRYIMQVFVTNKRRHVTERSQTFHIETSSIVKPSPVVGLRKVVGRSNASCLCLEWDHTDSVHDKLAIVMFTSQWSPALNMEKKVYFTRGPQETVICGLTPFSQYTIRVAVRPLPRGGVDSQGQDGFTSDWMYITERTAPSMPEVSPELCVGCFSYLPSGQPHRRNVLVYWKHIPWSLRNSVIHRYELRYTSGGKDGTVHNRSTTYPNNSMMLQNLSTDSQYSLKLVAITSEDKVSEHPTLLSLLPASDTPAGPESLLVETDWTSNGSWSGVFDLHWTGAGHATDSFLVIWCLGDIATRMCHHQENNQVYWQEVGSNTTSFTIDVKDGNNVLGKPPDYIVGVARQTQRHAELISSGIHWAECFYRFNSTPKYLPDNVQFSQVYQAGSLRVTWTYRICNSQATDVYISHFVIFYCVISDTSNSRCKGREENRTISHEARSVLLDNLEAGEYYKVSMAAFSRWGTGSERTQAVFSRVLMQPQQEEPRDLSVIGVILAVVVVIILLIIGICKLKSRLRKNEEKLTASFGDLPSLPADNAKSFKQDRPLPQVPPGTSGNTRVTYSAGADSLTLTDQQQKTPQGAGGKHKSITSETSLLGHEEAGTEEEVRRRHKPAVSSVPAERRRLLGETSTTTTSQGKPTATTPSRYDSDSGAESRYSSEDHDYAWVEGGGSASGASGEEAAASSHRGPPRPNQLLAMGHGYKSEALKHTSPVVASTAPSTDCALLPTGRRASSVSDYTGSEQPTLPRRPPGSRLQGYVPDDQLANPLGPYASTNVASFSHLAPPSPAPPPAGRPGSEVTHVEYEPARMAQSRGYVPHVIYSGSSTSSYSDDGRPTAEAAVRSLDRREGEGVGEPIYNPPWESSNLAPLVAVNRPLSLRMLHQLPEHFFDSSPSVNEGPTTEL